MLPFLSAPQKDAAKDSPLISLENSPTWASGSAFQPEDSQGNTQMGPQPFGVLESSILDLTVVSTVLDLPYNVIFGSTHPHGSSSTPSAFPE
jgi:hypothetical protein